MLIATLLDIQIEVGIAESIFNRNPSEFPYITLNTRWLYTWKICIEIKAKVKVWDEWLPKSASTNNRNIMEIAIKDPYYKGKYQIYVKLRFETLELSFLDLPKMANGKAKCQM